MPTGNPAGVVQTPVFLSGSANEPNFENLTPDELALFDESLRTIAKMESLERDLSGLLLSERDAFLWGASIAKRAFNKPFGGLLMNGSVNMQMIRPVTVLSNVPASLGGGGGTAVLSWKRYFSSTGWQALFGNQASPVSLGVSGSGTTATTTYERVMLVAPYLLSTGPTPRVAEIKPFVGQVSYPVFPIAWQKITDLYVARLPGVLLVEKNGQFAIEANITSVGMDEIALFGIQYVTSDYAVLES
jgi:hypothetical protein